MNTNHNIPQRPELLAGYADGELGPADRAMVEGWIATDATLRADLETQQRLTHKNADLWQKLAAPAPSDADWGRVLAGIEAGVQPAVPAVNYRTSGQRGWSRWAVAAAAIAALFMIAIGQNFLPKTTNGNPNGLYSADDAYQVAAASDVNILSVQGDDGMIVVGLLPLNGLLDVVTIGDTEFWATASEPSDAPSKPNVAPGDPKRPAWWNQIDKVTPVP